MFMRASGASELEHFCINFLNTKSAISFNILSVYQIFCRYKMICWSANTVPTNFQNVPTKLQKSIKSWGCPPPPPLATLVIDGAYFKNNISMIFVGAQPFTNARY